MKLAAAQHLSARIAGELKPFCEAIAVAGSIRRGRPECGDIDLVLIPADRNGLMNRLGKACKIESGLGHTAQNVFARLENGVKLELYLAHGKQGDLLDTVPSNFGSLLLCRTGSMEHNIKICERALQRGMKWDPYRGLMQPLPAGGMKWIAGETEQQIYAALDLPPLEPAERDAPFGRWAAHFHEEAPLPI